MTNILLLEDVPEASPGSRCRSPRSSRSPCSSSLARQCGARRSSPRKQIDVALIDLGLPDGSGVDVVAALREAQPKAQAVVVTIHDDDDHLFPALQAGAFGYVLKDQSEAVIVDQFRRMSQGEPPLSPAIARRVMAHFASRSSQRERRNVPHVVLTDRENEVLLRVAKGFTLPEIAVQLEPLAAHHLRLCQADLSQAQRQLARRGGARGAAARPVRARTPGPGHTRGPSDRPPVAPVQRARRAHGPAKTV